MFVQFPWWFSCIPFELEDWNSSEMVDWNSSELADYGDYPDESESSEYGDFFEGDMILSEEQMSIVFGERNAKVDEKYYWPNATVPYVLCPDHDIPYRQNIREAMDKIQNVSCIRFKQRKNESDYIQFEVSCNHIVLVHFNFPHLYE